MLLLHVLFGVLAFVGAVFLGASFGRQPNLSSFQKLAISFTYVGVLASAVLGFVSAMGMSVPLGLVTIGIVVFTCLAFFLPEKTAVEEEEEV